MDSKVLCGPLLRYTHSDYEEGVWHGSVLLVVSNSSNRPPTLHLSPEHFPDKAASIPGHPLHSENGSDGGWTFWRFSLVIPLWEGDQRVDYEIKLFEQSSRCCNASFYVPAKEESMRILFHSCNGFSVSVNKDMYKEPSLWNDVLRIHTQRPFHVMVGGGDQVYSDGVRVTGPLRVWANHTSPRTRAKVQVTEGLAKEMDEWYFRNYCEWYTTSPFKDAAKSIPAVQIFDDHDIIDGYGSYQDRFMRAPIFRQIGKVAWKYYMLFQQHTSPEGEGDKEDPTWVIGAQPGPYIEHPSRSICTTFGKRIVFYGLDCRVDRTIDRICSATTYEKMFERLNSVVNTETKHVLLLLGVPIAYPRLVWLETLLSTYTIAPLRWLNKLFGVASGLFNKFDGSVELLDDLTDHWCAGTHKQERNELVLRLQKFAEDKCVRITILSGDVHLACIGRFFSKKSLSIPQNFDHRYMVNVVSSAITNAPPPKAVANFLNRRNKMHHFDENTDENLMNIFHETPNGERNKVNHTTMPARNFCIIAEHSGLAEKDRNIRGEKSGVDKAETVVDNNMPAGETHEPGSNGSTSAHQILASSQGQARSKDTDTLGLAFAQEGSFQDRSANAPFDGTMRRFALDVCIRAEIDPRNVDGKTRGYGFSIPALDIRESTVQ